MAKVAADYLEGSARKAERVFGWNRQSVQLGWHERRTGLIWVDNYRARGRQKTEESLPNLEADIRAFLDSQSQADPKLTSVFGYARISTRAVRAALIREQGYDEEQLPTRQTIGEMLNQMGYPKAIDELKQNKELSEKVELRQNKYLNN